MFRRGLPDLLLDFDQLSMRGRQIDFDFWLGGADIARDIQIEVVGLDLIHLHSSGVPLDALRSLPVSVDDFLDMLVSKIVLSLPFLEMPGCVDEQDIIGLLALLQNEDADRNAGRVEQVRRQADNGVDVPVVEQLVADPRFAAATKQHAMRQDDGHCTVVPEVVKTVQQEREIRRRLRGQPVVLEPHILAQCLVRVPAVAERRVGDHGVEIELLRRIGLAEHVPFVRQRIAVVDLELRILHPVQQHVHPGEVVRGDVLLLSVNPADAAARLLHALSDVQQQRARAAGEVHHAGEIFALAGLRFLAVEHDDLGEDVRDPLRRVELAGLLARACGELADQIFIGVAQGVAIGRKLRQALGDPGDDRAELRVAVRVGLAELVGAEIDLREQSGERALE